jgi:serine/threonine protein kinase
MDPASTNSSQINDKNLALSQNQSSSLIASYQLLSLDASDQSHLQEVSANVQSAVALIFSSKEELNSEVISEDERMMEDIESVDSIASEQFSKEESPVLSLKREELLIEGKRYSVLGRGASKTILEKKEGDFQENKLERIYFVANSRLKNPELRQEVQTAKEINCWIESNCIIEEIKNRYQENQDFYPEGEAQLKINCEALRGIYTIETLKTLYSKAPFDAQKEIMQLTGSKNQEASHLLRLLGYPRYLLEDDPIFDLDAIKNIAMERQSHLAIDLEEIPETELGTYAVTSRKAIGDLEGLLTDENLSFADRSALCKQVCTSVSQLHSAGFIHGDLKPDNFLVYRGEDGKYLIKLADFGKTKKIFEGQELHRWGNPRYVGPENKSSKAGEVYGAALVCIRILEEPFLGSDKSLIEPTTKVSIFLQADKTRKGVERFLVDNGVTVHSESKSTVGKSLRFIKIFLANSDSKKVELELYRYIQALTVKMVDKEEADSPSEKKGISSCIEFLPFLYDALHSVPSERPKFSI